MLRKGKAVDVSSEERRRRNRRFNRILYCISAVLVLVGVYIILRNSTLLFVDRGGDRSEATFPPGTVTPTPTNEQVVEIPTGVPEPTVDWAYPTTTPAPSPTPEPTPIAPKYVVFYDHDITCPVEPVGLAEDGSMGTIPSATVAGWYMYGPAPNMPGNCIIAGHNRYAGQLGLFGILHNGLQVGDRIGVQMENGNYRFYFVATINTYLADDVPPEVMQLDGEDRLTLITCLGDYDWNIGMSRSRVVAVCYPLD